MKKDIVITVDTKTSMVYKDTSTMGIVKENIEANIIFKFNSGFVDGVAWLEFDDGVSKGYLEMQKVDETYVLPIKSSLLHQKGKINLQLRITQSENPNGIPVYKSNIFYMNVLDALDTTTEIPDDYPSWIEVADAKINEINGALTEVDNLNIEASKTDNVTTIVITDKEGTEHTTTVLDGADGQDGQDGQPGAPNTLTIGTVEKGENASATITGTSPNQVLNLVLPKGDKGSDGQPGRDGAIQYTAGANITIENNVISATGGSADMPIYLISGQSGTINLSANDIATINECCNKFTNNEPFNLYLKYHYVTQYKTFDFISEVEINNYTTNAQYNGYGWSVFSNGNPGRYKVDIALKGNWGEFESGFIYDRGEFEIAPIYDASLPSGTAGALLTNNTTSYNPTANYHPATKKYVDDAVAGAGGSGTPDNITTRKNSNDELETIGIYTTQNSAIKFWEGTLAQYNALQQKDSNTYYNITDDELANGLPQGGTTGQVLKKASSTDFDASWVSEHNYTHETWTFTLEDDATVDKEVVLW